MQESAAASGYTYHEYGMTFTGVRRADGGLPGEALRPLPVHSYASSATLSSLDTACAMIEAGQDVSGRPIMSADGTEQLSEIFGDGTRLGLTTGFHYGGRTLLRLDHQCPNLMLIEVAQSSIFYR